MYKVFINEKSLTLSNLPQPVDKNVKYEGDTSFEIAIDLLQSTSTTEVNLYHDHLEKMWELFQGKFKIIEAAGGLVKNAEQKNMFIFRHNKWDLPKGKIEPGESTTDAAVREVEEECGISDLILGDFIQSTYHVYAIKQGERILKKTYWYHMRYLGDAQPVPQLEEGISEVQFFDKKDIEERVFNQTFKNIALVLSNQWQDLQ
jgi:8-oxo-dGTP pyrophosphatase MutT (NUDIX family)